MNPNRRLSVRRMKRDKGLVPTNGGISHEKGTSMPQVPDIHSGEVLLPTLCPTTPHPAKQPDEH
jgi:hypothetical protein